jgi:hypothetical protein
MFRIVYAFPGYEIRQFDIDNKSIYVSLMIDMRFLEMHDEENTNLPNTNFVYGTFGKWKWFASFFGRFGYTFCNKMIIF